MWTVKYDNRSILSKTFVITQCLLQNPYHSKCASVVHLVNMTWRQAHPIIIQEEISTITGKKRLSNLWFCILHKVHNYALIFEPHHFNGYWFSNQICLGEYKPPPMRHDLLQNHILKLHTRIADWACQRESGDCEIVRDSQSLNGFDACGPRTFFKFSLIIMEGACSIVFHIVLMDVHLELILIFISW